MTRHNTIGTALLVVGAVLFVLPALVPVQPVLVHDTSLNTFDNAAELQADGVEIIRYENLSERGQELYVTTLESGGRYEVSPGEGATDFEYLTQREHSERVAETEQRRPATVAIQRPPDADLPPADEPFGGEGSDASQDEDHRQTVQRYELMHTAKEPPSLGSAQQLIRLGAALLAVLSVGVGGYLRSQP